MDFDRKIMVIKRDTLFAEKYFNGFVKADYFDFEGIILKNFEWMQRGFAEKTKFFKQPIGYAILYNPSSTSIFLYQRSSKDKYYKEKRLQGNFSCGVGGHIKKLDIKDTNPIYASILREVSEEIEIADSLRNLNVIGYINDDSNDVGIYHFGIIYLIEIGVQIVNPKDPEISNGRLIHIKEFEKICNDPKTPVESWTKIALEPLKKYIGDTI
jgi:predicted NUDIX family phosphoesterase